MAIGWLTALKFVPWGDVIEAAPAVVNSARRFLNRSQQPVSDAEPRVAAEALAHQPPLVRLEARVDALEASNARLVEQQQSSAALIETLAEQNAQLIRALDVLRKRSSLAWVGFAAFAAGVVGWLAWVGR